MNKLTLLLCGLLGTIALSTSALADDSDTRELRREIMKLHGDIRMSAAGQQLLAENTSLAPQLSKSDNATILAALEGLRNEEVKLGNAPLIVTADAIAVARHKIEIYKMLCMSAKPHPKIFAKYCENPPYAEFYKSYVGNIASLASQ